MDPQGDQTQQGAAGVPAGGTTPVPPTGGTPVPVTPVSGTPATPMSGAPPPGTPMPAAEGYQPPPGTPMPPAGGYQPMPGAPLPPAGGGYQPMPGAPMPPSGGGYPTMPTATMQGAPMPPAGGGYQPMQGTPMPPSGGGYPPMPPDPYQQMPGGYPPAGSYPPPPPEDTTPANFQLGTKLPPKLNAKAPKHELKFDEEYFIRLLAGSISLSKDEKRKIIDSIPKLKQAQIDELIRIFEEEKQKFAALSQKHVPQLEKLAQQHYNEWMDLETDEQQSSKKQEDTSKADEIRKNLGL